MSGVSLRRATVTALTPLRIQFDGEAAPVPSSPSSLVPVGPGDRVMVAHHARQMTIVGCLSTEGRPWREATGVMEITGTGATTAAGIASFPEGRFTLTPMVDPTVWASVYIPYRGNSTSATQIEVGVRRFDGAVFTGTVMVSWRAVQMTPTSAAG